MNLYQPTKCKCYITHYYYYYYYYCCCC